MSITLAVKDETTTGKRSDAILLEFSSKEMTIRELIRERVYQEVKDYNAAKASGIGLFHGLVQPEGAELTLNGYKMKKARMIDWQPQFEKACTAFEANHVIILINEKQAETLDEKISLQSDMNICFLKLVPLVGG